MFVSDSKVSNFSCKVVNSNQAGCLKGVSTQAYMLSNKFKKYLESWKPSRALTVGVSSGRNITQHE